MDESHQHEEVVADLNDLQAMLRGDEPTDEAPQATVHELAWFRRSPAPERGRDAKVSEEASVTSLASKRSDDLAARIWKPRQPFTEAIERLRLAERVSSPDPDSLAAGAREAAKKASELQQLANRRLDREA